MDLTREEAVRLFHEQWSDMQKDLGDIPITDDRLTYKRRWCASHRRFALNSCFLCEYVRQEMTRQGLVGSWLFCRSLCPIAWPTRDGTCCIRVRTGWLGVANDYYLIAPISEILALPVRDGGEDG